MIAKMFGAFPVCLESFSIVSFNSGAACSFVSGFTTPIFILLYFFPARIEMFLRKFIKANINPETCCVAQASACGFYSLARPIVLGQNHAR
jgi:hypothetical protein